MNKRFILFLDRHDSFKFIWEYIIFRGEMNINKKMFFSETIFVEPFLDIVEDVHFCLVENTPGVNLRKNRYALICSK